MNSALRAATAIVLAMASLEARSEQPVGEIYLVPHGGYVWLDDDRAAKDDRFLGLAIGKHVSDAISLELNVTRGTYDLAANQDIDLTAYSVDLLRVFARDAQVSPYVSIGLGALHTSPSAQDSSTPVLAQAGLGMMIDLFERNDGSLRFGLRPEVKARLAMARRIDPDHRLLDYTAGLGFMFSFGSPRPEPTPEPVAAPAPPPPPPAPAAPKDTDGDGVIDDRDRCPGTPRGVAVDADGCPRRGSATLQGVTFEFNSATLTSESRPVLTEVAADLKRYPRLRIELQGHTDSVGNDAYNLQLSEKRAQSVRDFLIAEGVGDQQLTAKGYGETMPVSDNKTNEGRAENRRVVMAVTENPGDVDVAIEQPSTEGAL